MNVLMIFVAIPAVFYVVMLIIFGGTPTGVAARARGPKQFDCMRCVENGEVTYSIDPQTIRLIDEREA